MRLVIKPLNSQSGTTIIELMIATMAFSTMLLVIAFGIMSFTTDYYRGLNASSTQNVAGSIIKAVSQAIQFGEQAPVHNAAGGSAPAWCIGNQAFVYNLGAQITTATNTSIGLAQANVSNCNSAIPTTGLHEMLQPRMRVVAFNVNQVSDQLWSVNVKVAYGDNDLLCGGGISCSSGSVASDAQIVANATALRCKSHTGSQFCAVSNLTTTVERRIN